MKQGCWSKIRSCPKRKIPYDRGPHCTITVRSTSEARPNEKNMKTATGSKNVGQSEFDSTKHAFLAVADEEKASKKKQLCDDVEVDKMSTKTGKTIKVKSPEAVHFAKQKKASRDAISMVMELNRWVQKHKEDELEAARCAKMRSLSSSLSDANEAVHDMGPGNDYDEAESKLQALLTTAKEMIKRGRK